MDREILVSLDLHGAAAFVGRLWCRTRRGRHSASFEYDPGAGRFSVDVRVHSSDDRVQ